jgi:hypothetical protein
MNALKRKKLSKSHLVLGIILIISLLGLLLFYNYPGSVGQVVFTKGSTIDKKYISPSISPPLTQDNQDSDTEGASCMTCSKQYEFRTVQALCGLRNSIMHEDPGIDATCISTDPYLDYSTGEGRYIGILSATARCTSGKIISYGASCPSDSTMTELKPTIFPYPADANFWTDLPLVEEVQAKCERVPASPPQENRFMYIYVTCMREKQ